MNMHRKMLNASRKILSRKYIRSSSENLPQLTRERYNLERKNFTYVNNYHIDFFKNTLGADNVITENIYSYNTDWIKNYRGDSSLVLKPRTTEEVSNILKYCNENNLAVCPQGGNTGLVGGSIPIFDEVILNTERMNSIISVDSLTGALVCEAGCVLQDLDEYLRPYDLMMPLDFAAKDSCHIGGNISTNAGGIRVLRYGNLHGRVLGIEAVRANGDIVDCLGTLKKDNMGNYLYHMFIGSEGTLGIVTKVAIECPTVPSNVNVALLGVNEFSDVLKVYTLAKKTLSEILSAFEMADAAALDLSTRYLNLENPIREHPFYIFIETHGSHVYHDEDKLSNFIDKAMLSGSVMDGTLSSKIKDIKAIWALRDGIPEGLTHEGYTMKYDFSIPIRNYYDIVPMMRDKLGIDAIRVCGYGHIADSNIHLNISLREFSPAILKRIEPFVYKYVSDVKGSISAEHGIGFKKSGYMHYSKNHSCIRTMKELKSMMDPKGILNPYKVLL